MDMVIGYAIFCETCASECDAPYSVLCSMYIEQGSIVFVKVVFGGVYITIVFLARIVQ